MAYLATDRYTATNGQTDFAVTFEFIEAAHVKLYINGVASTDFTLSGDGNTLTVGASHTFTGGEEIVIRRQSVSSETYVTFLSGNVSKASDLNLSRKHLVYLIQEANDWAEDAKTGSFLPAGANSQWDAQERLIQRVKAPVSGTDAARKADVDNATSIESLHRMGANRIVPGHIGATPMRIVFADEGWKSGSLDKGWRCGDTNTAVTLLRERIPGHSLYRGAQFHIDLLGEYYLRGAETIANNIIKFNFTLNGVDIGVNSNLKPLLSNAETGQAYVSYGVDASSPFPTTITEYGSIVDVGDRVLANNDDLLYHLHASVYALGHEQIFIEGWTRLYWIDTATTMPGSAQGNNYPHFDEKHFAWMSRQARGTAGNNDTVNPTRMYDMQEGYILDVTCNAGNTGAATPTDPSTWKSFLEISHINFHMIGAER